MPEHAHSRFQSWSVCEAIRLFDVTGGISTQSQHLTALQIPVLLSDLGEALNEQAIPDRIATDL